MTLERAEQAVDVIGERNMPKPSDGDLCPHFGDQCCGRLVLMIDGDCSCHISPPCPACECAFLVCDDCGYDTRDDAGKQEHET